MAKGKKPITIDADLVKNLAAVPCSIAEIAVLIGVSHATLRNHLEKNVALRTSIEDIWDEIDRRQIAERSRKISNILTEYYRTDKSVV
jgi:DNA-binding transcriptional ArsR family regulator